MHLNVHITWQQERKNKEINTTETLTARMGLLTHSSQWFCPLHPLHHQQQKCGHSPSHTSALRESHRQCSTVFQLQMSDADAQAPTWNHRLKTNCLRVKQTKPKANREAATVDLKHQKAVVTCSKQQEGPVNNGIHSALNWWHVTAMTKYKKTLLSYFLDLQKLHSQSELLRPGQAIMII